MINRTLTIGMTIFFFACSTDENLDDASNELKVTKIDSYGHLNETTATNVGLKCPAPLEVWWSCNVSSNSLKNLSEVYDGTGLHVLPQPGPEGCGVVVCALNEKLALDAMRLMTDDDPNVRCVPQADVYRPLNPDPAWRLKDVHDVCVDRTGLFYEFESCGYPGSYCHDDGDCCGDFRCNFDRCVLGSPLGSVCKSTSDCFDGMHCEKTTGAEEFGFCSCNPGLSQCKSMLHGCC